MHQRLDQAARFHLNGNYFHEFLDQALSEPQCALYMLMEGILKKNISFIGLRRLLDISHDHKFPSEYRATTLPSKLACSSMHFCCNYVYYVFLCYLFTRSVFFTVIPFKPEMAVELQEKGRVRFWAQIAKFTSKCQVEYVFNDNIITQGKV